MKAIVRQTCFKITYTVLNTIEQVILLALILYEIITPASEHFTSHV